MSKGTIQAPSPSLFGPVIHRYTRADALADGMLIDAGPLAVDAGFRWPVALTTGAWEDCVAWTDADSDRQVYQDVSGRLWDVLSMALFAIKRAPAGTQRAAVPISRVPRDGHSMTAALTTLHLTCGPGDDDEPVMTLLLPNED